MYLAKSLEFISIYSLKQNFHRQSIKMKLGGNRKESSVSLFFFVFYELFCMTRCSSKLVIYSAKY